MIEKIIVAEYLNKWVSSVDCEQCGIEQTEGVMAKITIGEEAAIWCPECISGLANEIWQEFGEDEY